MSDPVLHSSVTLELGRATDITRGAETGSGKTLVRALGAVFRGGCNDLPPYSGLSSAAGEPHLPSSCPHLGDCGSSRAALDTLGSPTEAEFGQDRARQAAQDPDAPNPLQSRGLVSRHRGRLVARSAAVLQEKKGKHEDMMRQASCSNQI